MSAELEAKIDKLEETLEKVQKPSWGKITIGTIITLVVLALGTAVSWGTLRAEVVDLKEDLGKVEMVQDKQQEEINDTKLKGVQDSADIKHIKDDVGEVKTEVGEINEKLDRLLEE